MSEHVQVTSPTLDRSPARTPEFVVGFDGSPSSRRALELAGLLGDVRGGHISVVYVAHMPAIDTLAPQVIVPARENLDQIEAELSSAAASILTASNSPWRFIRRDGDIAHELLATAEEAAATDDDRPRPVVIIVGSSDHRHDQWLGSVPRRLTRQNRIALAVVPSTTNVSSTGDTD